MSAAPPMAAAVAPGQAPLQDVNQGVWYVVINWVLRALAIIIVLLRIYTRRVAKNTAGWDDVCIAFAALVSLLGGISDTIKVAHGFGRHAIFLSEHDLVVNAQFLPMSQLCNFIDLFFSRASICLFTLRLLPKTQKWPQRLTWIAFALNFLVTLANCLIFSLQCKPTTIIISKTQTDGCVGPDQLVTALATAGVISVLVDFSNVGVPVFIIRNLQLNRRAKISIAIVMSLGTLTAACSIGKLLAVRGIRDPTWDGIPVSVWGLFEENCAIICASMPAMRQLYKHVQARRRGAHIAPLGVAERGGMPPGGSGGSGGSGGGASRAEKGGAGAPVVSVRRHDGSSSRTSLVAPGRTLSDASAHGRAGDDIYEMKPIEALPQR